MLLAAMGSPHTLQVDGIGGGHPLTSKVAIVGPSNHPSADIDYLFAQVGVDDAFVNTNVTCGNMLSAVGPYAIEAGLIATESPRTNIRIRSLNAGWIVHASVETPGRRLRYDGDLMISGCNSPGSPITLSFIRAEGGLTGRLLPSRNLQETIHGIPVSLVDYATAMMLVDATKLGINGEETAQEIEANHELFQTLEAMRLIAGQRMGLGDVSKSVIPKVALVTPPRRGGSVASRYLTPWRCHNSHALTGGLCLTAAIGMKGTIASELAHASAHSGSCISIEHPAGTMEISCRGQGSELVTTVTRTARLLFTGNVYVPEAVFRTK